MTSNQGDNSPGRQRSGRSRLVAGALAVLTALGAAVWLLVQNAADREVARQQEQAGEERQAQVDAGRLIIDHSFSGHPCEYTAVGWDAPSAEMPPLRGGTVEAIQAGAAIGGSGLVRLHFTLPTTAGMTAIDVRSIDVMAVPVADTAPAWQLTEEGCGGGQYSQDYAASIVQGRAQVRRVGADGEVENSPFEPFSVTPGETVHINYVVASCDAQTYDVSWRVHYVADIGDDFAATIPAEGSVRVAGAIATQSFFHLDGERHAWEAVDASPPALCAR
jgi:hypothetical protein